MSILFLSSRQAQGTVRHAEEAEQHQQAIQTARAADADKMAEVANQKQKDGLAAMAAAVTPIQHKVWSAP